MSENAPGIANAGASSGDANRGLPYYDQLRDNLRQLLTRKRIVDRNGSALEDRIYKFEGHYLEETSSGGNIIKGFDNYIKGSSSGGGTGTGGGGTSRKKTAVNDADRVFSRSSASFNSFNDNSPGATAPSSAHTTPSHAPTPTATSFNGNREGSNQLTGLTNGGNKGIKRNKKKAEDGDGEEDTKSNKRVKVNFGHFGGS